MNTSEIKDILKNPPLLNLVCGLATLDRIYEMLPGETPSWGHFYSVLGYLVGFVIGLDPFKKWEAKADSYSYGLLVVATAWLLVCVFCDVHNICS